MQRFFVDPKNIQGFSVYLENPEILHQMNAVLRMKVGDPFIVLDNTGMEFICALKEISKKKALASITEERKNAAEPNILVRLYQALPKQMEKFEWVLQKGTEIGVSEFVPLITERTERQEIRNHERLQKILKEAAEQSERGKIPTLAKTTNFKKIESTAPETARVILDCRHNPPLISQVVSAIKNSSVVELIIGPEGGFTESELALAEDKNFLIASLGPRVLRTETAGIAAASVLLL